MARAAVLNYAIEPETDTLRGNASIVSNSGVSAVMFGQAPVPAQCNLDATTSNFASQVSAATTDQTVCLASEIMVLGQVQQSYSH